jgi:hypothetical protein
MNGEGLEPRAYRPGDVYNGYRLTEAGQWEPVTKPKPGRWVGVAVGIVAVLFIGNDIASGISGFRQTVDNADELRIVHAATTEGVDPVLVERARYHVQQTWVDRSPSEQEAVCDHWLAGPEDALVEAVKGFEKLGIPAEDQLVLIAVMRDFFSDHC